MKRGAFTLNVVALVVACIAIGYATHVHMAISATGYSDCYGYETHVSSGTIERAQWFAEGTMIYFRRATDDSQSYVAIPWHEPMENLSAGNTMTITTVCKYRALCRGGTPITKTNVCVENTVTSFEVQASSGRHG